MDKIFNLTEDDWSDASDNIDEIVYQYLENCPKEELLSTKSVFIYEGVPVQKYMKDYIDVDYMLDMAESNACDEVGEFAYGWLDYVTTPQRDELAEMITQWANKNNLQPKFQHVDEVKEIEVEVDEVIRNELLKLLEGGDCGI